MILDLLRHEVEFKNIHGYDDIKDLVRRALYAEDNYNLLFIGPPASAKTLFLLGILESKKGNGVYFDGSNTTNRILDVLEEKRPKLSLGTPGPYIANWFNDVFIPAINPFCVCSMLYACNA
jgi:hypothetical protein